MKPRLVKGAFWLFSKLPLSAAHFFGAFFGYLVWFFPNKSRTVASTNIALCLPELDARAQRRLCRRALLETGKTLFETGPLWHLNPEHFEQLMVDEQGREAVDAAMATGRGVIMITPHLGSWEMGGHYCARHWQITNLYRPPRMRALEELIVAGRTRLGAGVAPTTAQGIRLLYQRLRAGGMVGILPDQDPGDSGGVFAPFFGIPANTMLLLGRLARKTGAAVFLGYCERLPGLAQGYRAYFTPAPAGIDDPDPVLAASALNRGVEQLVRMKPEQYQWGYRRFRTRPDDAQRIY